MPDKPWQRLNSLDRELREAFPAGMQQHQQGVRMVIEMISGFELFNSRPYHNYETFSSGYRVSTPTRDLVVQAEDLDDAVRLFIRKVKERFPND